MGQFEIRPDDVSIGQFEIRPDDEPIGHYAKFERDHSTRRCTIPSFASGQHSNSDLGDGRDTTLNLGICPQRKMLGGFRPRWEEDDKMNIVMKNPSLLVPATSGRRTEREQKFSRTMMTYIHYIFITSSPSREPSRVFSIWISPQAR